MTTLPPSTPRLTALVKPMLADYVVICHQLPEDERRQFEALSDGEPYDPERHAITLASTPGPRWALVGTNGEALAIGGFTYIRPLVWQDWLIGTPAAWTHHWRTISKHCRRMLDRMLETEAHRIQCVSLADRTAAHHWYRVLGYEREGVLRCYGANGEDAVMFSRVARPAVTED